MINRLIGINSSIPSIELEINLVEFTEIGSGCTYKIIVSDLLNYPDEWEAQLQNVAKKKRMLYQRLIKYPV